MHFLIGKKSLKDVSRFFENKWGTYSATFFSSEESNIPHQTIVFAHGLGAQKEWYSWIGYCLASQGFSALLFTVPSRRLLDPRQWSDGIKSAIDYLLSKEGSLHDEICPEKIGAMGHSMGGLGALIAGSEDHRIKCIVGLAPAVRPERLLELKVNITRFRSISVPVQLQIGSNDGLIAPESVKTFLESLHSEHKSYIEIDGGNHMRFADKTTSVMIGEYFSRFGVLGRRFQDRKAKITFEEQHSISRGSFVEWFNRYLKQ
jgi:alpha-beta hydrolase superfamily lysophospholipase